MNSVLDNDMASLKAISELDDFIPPLQPLFQQLNHQQNKQQLQQLLNQQPMQAQINPQPMQAQQNQQPMQSQ